jgi:3-oxosteroid 1-dehydrogenase
MAKIGAVQFKEFRLFFVDRPAPDYADHLPENKTPTGRSLEPAVGAGSSEGGSSLAVQLEEWLTARNVPVLTEHRVTRLVTQGGRVVGVEAQHGDRKVRIRARRGVVFGTGGYAHNPELIGLHQTALYGSCAAPGATGDFIPIAAEAGARMGTLHTAWRTQVLVEEALENRVMGFCAFVLPGDSMIVVNKYGKRVCNEKRDYNDRTMVHFTFDSTREEYSNHLLYMIADARSLDAFGGAYPFPVDKRESRWLIEGATIDELAANIAQRLATISDKVGSQKLEPEFARETKASIERFNGYAEQGRDPEFERGLHAYDREWHLLFSARREGTRHPVNPKPNITMHPFTKTGPYYAFILAAGALDTNGGPQINEKAQVLAHDGKPIPGLYGAGNCIASPSRAAYYGAGGTIGLALTFGYIAGMNVAQETPA